MENSERLRSIWLSADESYINALKESNSSSPNPEPESSRFPIHVQKPALEEESTKSDDDNCSFIAIPEEFRPFGSKKEQTSKNVVDKCFNVTSGTNANFAPFGNSLTEQTLEPMKERLNVKINRSDKVQKMNLPLNETNDNLQTFRTKSNQSSQLSAHKEAGFTTHLINNGQANVAKKVSWDQTRSKPVSYDKNGTPEAAYSLKAEFDEMSLNRNCDASNYRFGNIQLKSELIEPDHRGQAIKWNSSLISSEFEETNHQYRNKKKTSYCSKVKNGKAAYSSVSSTLHKNIRWNGDLCFEADFQRRSICYERYSFTEENVGRKPAEKSKRVSKAEISKQSRIFLKPDFPIKLLEDSDFDVPCTSDSSSVSDGKNKAKTEEVRKITWMNKMTESNKRSYEPGYRTHTANNNNADEKIRMKTQQVNIDVSGDRELHKNKKYVHRRPRCKDNIIRHEVKVIHVYTSDSMNCSEKAVEPLAKGNSHEFFEMLNNNAEEKTKSDNSAVAEMNDTKKKESTEPTDGVIRYPEKLNFVTPEVRIMLIQYGKEISDLIVGCHRAVDIFMSFYHKWIADRKASRELVSVLSQTLAKSQRNIATYQNVFKLLGDGGTALGYLPNFYASITGKVLIFLSKMIGKYFSSSPNAKDLDDSKMLQIIEIDVDSTSSLYTHALQCSSQFEDTEKLIEEFHQSILDGYYISLSSEPDISSFLRDFTEYKVTHNIFYARLCRCFQKLKNGNTSEFKRAFCTAFEDFPAAMDIIPHMKWRFDFADNGDSVLRDTLSEMNDLFGAPDSATVKELERVINNCMKVLTREQTLMEIHLKCFESLYPK